MKTQVSWRAVGVFVAVAYGLGALVALPLLLLEPGHPAAVSTLVLMAMMFTPSIAVAVVHKTVAPMSSWRAETGLQKGRLLGSTVLAGWLGTPLIVFATIAVSALLGWIQLDLVGLSGMVELLETLGAQEALEVMPPHVLLAAQVLQAVLMGAVLNFFFALGEELGWRGWLQPQLMPLGALRAMLLTGAIWGLWHTPAIWAGHNFPGEPVLGPIVMTLACMGWGVWLGWLRLRSNSVIVPALAHGVLNGTAGIVALVHQAGTESNPLLVLAVGVSGILVTGLVSLILWLQGALVAPNPRAESGAPEAEAT